MFYSGKYYKVSSQHVHLVDLTLLARYVRQETIEDRDWHVFAANFKDYVLLRVRLPCDETSEINNDVRAKTLVERPVQEKEGRSAQVKSFIEETYQLATNLKLKGLIREQL